MAKLNLGKKDFEVILSSYDIGAYKSSKHVWQAFGNTTFILKTTEGKYVVKLFHTKNLRHMKFQVELIDTLGKKNLPVPKILRTSEDRLLLKHKDSFLFMQEFVDGRHTYSFTPKLVKNCAKILVSLDKQLTKTKMRLRFGYKPNHQFTHKNFKVKRIGDFNLSKEAKEINKSLKKIKREKLRNGFIHGDFHGVNLLSKNDKITAVLDFDDSHYDYTIEEIAVFLAHSFVHKDKVDKEMIRLFMKEYQKKIRLNKEEEKALYYFIKQRFLASLDWTEKHRKNLKDRKKIKEVNRNLRNSIKSYHNFGEIALEEFLHLLE